MYAIRSYYASQALPVSQFAPSGESQSYSTSSNLLPQSGGNTSQTILKSGNYTAQTSNATIQKPNAAGKKKLSKGAKIGIGIGALALLGTGA